MRSWSVRQEGGDTGKNILPPPSSLATSHRQILSHLQLQQVARVVSQSCGSKRLCANDGSSQSSREVGGGAGEQRGRTELPTNTHKEHTQRRRYAPLTTFSPNRTRLAAVADAFHVIAAVAGWSWVGPPSSAALSSWRTRTRHAGRMLELAAFGPAHDAVPFAHRGEEEKGTAGGRRGSSTSATTKTRVPVCPWERRGSRRRRSSHRNGASLGPLPFTALPPGPAPSPPPIGKVRFSCSGLFMDAA